MYGKIKEYLAQELEAIKENGLYKKERIIASPQGAETTTDPDEDENAVLEFAHHARHDDLGEKGDCGAGDADDKGNQRHSLCANMRIAAG